VSADPFVARVARDLVVVGGADATSFLQSLVSQDLAPVGVGEAVPALLLQPQGKILVAFVARRADDTTWQCVCEGGFGAVLAAGLERFRIRVDVAIEERAVAAAAVRGAAAPIAPDVPAGVTLVPVAWAGRPAPGAPAYDAFGTEADVAAFVAGLGLPVADGAEYEIARIEAGVPRMGTDLDETTIPQEAGVESDAVSFTKGCFVGQELVCRIDSRGHVNRHLRRLRAVDRADGALAGGAAVEADGVPVGTVTSPGPGVALAMIRREVEPGTVVVVGGTPVVVETLAPG